MGDRLVVSFVFIRMKLLVCVDLFVNHCCMLNLPEDDKSKDIILRAAVFSFKVWVTVTFGFLTRLPKVEFAQVDPYDVLQRVETGDFCLTIVYSN